MLLMSLVFVLVVSVDQLAKRMIVACLDEGAYTTASILGVRLHHVVNRRKPWASAGAVRIMSVVWLLLSVTAVIVASVADNSSIYVALGCLVGGAAGNLIDGFSRHGVTDFIDARVWPVFNVADTAIVGGACLLMWNAVRLRAGA